MITIYGNQTCPFCLRAKRLCESYKLKYQWLDTDEEQILIELKERKEDVKTIPQIWWDERYIGGYTELASEVENTSGGFGDGSL